MKWRELKDEHVTVMQEVKDATILSQRKRLGTQKTKLLLSHGQGRRVASWIWMSTGGDKGDSNSKEIYEGIALPLTCLI